MNKKGFTLLELLVVITIIGLLSTLAVFSFNAAVEKKCRENFTQECSEKFPDLNGAVLNESKNLCDGKKVKCRYNCAHNEIEIEKCYMVCDADYDYCQLLKEE